MFNTMEGDRETSIYYRVFESILYRLIHYNKMSGTGYCVELAVFDIDCVWFLYTYSYDNMKRPVS
jgi:hypothetical protein